MKAIIFFLLMAGSAIFVMGQANIDHPRPIKLESGYTQNFEKLGTSFPDGWGAWNVVTAEQVGNAANPRTAEPARNVSSLVRGTAAAKRNFVYNFDGKLGFKNGKYSDYAIVVALNTKSVKSKKIKISFDAMVIRNLYDGLENKTVYALALQYRVGENGSFKNIGETVQNGINTQTYGVNPVDLQNFAFELPEDCNSKPVVQLRWIVKYVSGEIVHSDLRPSFAIDNFVIKVVSN